MFLCLQIEVWIGFFYRNTAPMQIVNGGKTAEYFQQCVIMQEITGNDNFLLCSWCSVLIDFTYPIRSVIVFLNLSTIWSGKLW